MKKLFLSLVAMMAVSISYAQSSLVATLSHGDEITMYYGIYALRDAHNAAQSGDVINLSGGAFQAVNITKAVTLRGIGIDDASPTYISGNFAINIPSDDTNRLSFEGIRCTETITMKGTFNGPYFIKSQFYAFNYDYYNAPTIKNVLFVNCKITSSYELRGTSTVQFVNSFVRSFHNNSESTASASFVNCLIMPHPYWGETYNSSNVDRNYRPDYISSSQLFNCVVYARIDEQIYQLPLSTIATNCVAIGFKDLFGVQAANSNNNTATFSQLFKDFTGIYSDSQTFELTEEAKTQFLGTDGTEVGIHGGLLPYNSKPSYPQITKMNVANKTTADGKLSVEIEVSAVE